MYLTGMEITITLENYIVLTLKQCILVNNVPQKSHFINASIQGKKYAWELEGNLHMKTKYKKVHLYPHKTLFSPHRTYQISSCIFIHESYVFKDFFPLKCKIHGEWYMINT